MKNLPEKLSDLIPLAKEDAIKAFDSPLYRLNMSIWHSMHDELCEVCLAGAVLAFSLGADSEKYFYPAGFIERKAVSVIESKLTSLDLLRVIDLAGAVYHFYGLETMNRVVDELDDLYKKHKNIIILNGIIKVKKEILDFFSQPIMVEFIEILKKHNL